MAETEIQQAFRRWARGLVDQAVKEALAQVPFLQGGKVRASGLFGVLPTAVQQAILAANLSSGAAADGTVLTADGSGGVAFEAPAGGSLANHDHSGDAGDGGTFDAANLSSGASTDGQVLTSDGAGGAAWENPPAGGVVDAADVTYTPAVAADWNTDADPGDVDAALDQLAARVDDLEAAGGAEYGTVDITPGATVSVINYFGSRTGAKAIDNSWATDEFCWHTNADVTDVWWKIQFATGKIIGKINIRNGVPQTANRGLKNCKMEGSNDDSTWTKIAATSAENGPTIQNTDEFQLANQSPSLAAVQTVYFANSATSYTYYRIWAADGWGDANYIGFAEIEMMEKL